ncbi:hypothetical protein AV530_003452 [Patagioenas fasciata monilis]|uniref:Uncharacterized protein n=1 Tax=Patagioenas fasciata monilis TaxID=372326 RepID=A0A1V4K2S4_PATFA|nr:hypothetical protein AV530_003452 [Patagioenas fasciata monilis]
MCKNCSVKKGRHVLTAAGNPRAGPERLPAEKCLEVKSKSLLLTSPVEGGETARAGDFFWVFILRTSFLRKNPIKDVHELGA